MVIAVVMVRLALAVAASVVAVAAKFYSVKAVAKPSIVDTDQGIDFSGSRGWLHVRCAAQCCAVQCTAPLCTARHDVHNTSRGAATSWCTDSCEQLCSLACAHVGGPASLPCQQKKTKLTPLRIELGTLRTQVESDTIASPSLHTHNYGRA